MRCIMVGRFRLPRYHILPPLAWAMKRFVRPLCYQDVPDELLPRELQIPILLG